MCNINVVILKDPFQLNIYLLKKMCTWLYILYILKQKEYCLKISMLWKIMFMFGWYFLIYAHFQILYSIKTNLIENWSICFVE